MTKKYQHIFFDLDHTLWDYEANARLTLIELFDRFELGGYGIESGEEFYQHFTVVNDELWDKFNHGSISKYELRGTRFPKVLERSGAIMKLVAPDFIKQIAQAFVKECSFKSTTFPGAREIVEYLHPKYPLHIITNGFEETQSNKLRSAGLLEFFDVIITSERAGSKKPYTGMFNYAMKQTGAAPETAVIIGDNLQTDMKGGRDFGMDTIYFNPAGVKHSEQVDYEIEHLLDLKKLL